MRTTKLRPNRGRLILSSIIGISAALIAELVLLPQPYNWIGGLAICGPLFVSIMAYKRYRQNPNLYVNENENVNESYQKQKQKQEKYAYEEKYAYRKI